MNRRLAALTIVSLALPLAACSSTGSSTPSATVTVTAPASTAGTQAGTTAEQPTTTQTVTETQAAPATRTVTETATQAPEDSATETKAAPQAAAEPVLGLASAFPAGRGYGSARPSEISYGGDPTGTVTGITWSSWGGKTAIGKGTSTWIGNAKSVAEGVQSEVTVRASGLTTCDGKPAYRTVTWWFPTHGETGPSSDFEPRDLCATN